MEKIRKLKIRKRLFISFFATFSVASVAGIIGLVLIMILSSRYAVAIRMNGFVQGDIGEYNTYLNRGSAMVRDVLLLNEQEEKEKAIALVEDCDEKVQYYLNEFLESVETEEELALLDDITKEYNMYLEKRQAAIDLGLEGKQQEAEKVLQNDAMPHLNKIVVDSEELLRVNQEEGERVASNLTSITVTN